MPSRETIRKVVGTLRGNDLLVELGLRRFLLILPQTLQEGAQVLLDRIRVELGNPAMGATLWLPERDDLLLGAALRRAEQARVEALAAGGGIQWRASTLVLLA